jgi:deoxyribose-phosphate aldolase
MYIKKINELASKIDLTLLKPDATINDIENLCKNAIKYKFWSVCVNPFFVKFVSEKLKKYNIYTCTVIGFPLGATTISTKIFEACEALDNGANEIDMVMNISAFKSKNYEYVKNEIKNIVEESKIRKPESIIKVIIETCLLTNEEKSIACDIIISSGADFVKTSTGFSKSGATIEDVKLLKKNVNGKLKIKASGGIRNLKQALDMIEAGADRIGTSHGVEIIEEILNISKK